MADDLDTELTKLKRMFEQSQELTRDSEEEAIRNRDYYDGRQLSDAEVSTLKGRFQPLVIDNKIKDKVENLVGLVLQTQTDPKAFPRTPDSESSAEAATDALRFVAENNNWHRKRKAGSQNYFVEGIAACEVIWAKDSREIEINHIPWDRFIYDPHSRRDDFSDARYLGQAIWEDLEQAKLDFPDKAEALEASMESRTVLSERYDDRPSPWTDFERKRVRFIELYYKTEGTVKRALFTIAGFLEDPKESAYKDELGRRIWTYEAQAAYTDKEGKRYGPVSRYIDLQDEINKRRSKILDLLSRRNIVAEQGAVDNINKAVQQLHRPDGAVEVVPGRRFEVLGHEAEIVGQTNLLQQTLAQFDDTGPNAALQGQTGSVSGRAKQIDQQAGVITLGGLLDGINDWENRVYRKIWNCVQQFWTDQRWVRVRDVQEKMKFVALNRRLDPLVALNEGLIDEQQAQQLVLEGRQFVENPVSELDIDIIIEEVPDTVTIQHEQFQNLTNLATAGVVFPPEVYIEASDLRNKANLIEMLRGGGDVDPQVQQLQQQVQRLQEQFQQLELAEKAVEIQETQAKTENIHADTAKKEAEALNAVLQ